MNRILIINGIDNDKDLSKCGDKLAELYQKSNIIYIINKKNECYRIKGNYDEPIPIIKYFDALAGLKSVYN